MSLFGRKPRASIRVEGEVCVITFTGSLDIGTGDVLITEHVQKRIDAGDKFFLLDMSGVTYVSDSALGACGGALARAIEVEGNLGILRPARNVERFIRDFRLDKVFPIYDDEATALRRIREDRLLTKPDKESSTDQ